MIKKNSAESFDRNFWSRHLNETYVFNNGMVSDSKDNKGKENDVLDNDVLLEILSIANGGASLSEIKSRITKLKPGVLLSKYLDHSIQSNLLGYDDQDPTIYTTTEEGLRFLESYERVETGTADKQPPEGLFDIK